MPDRPAEPLIFEKSVPGRRAGTLPPCDVPAQPLSDLLPEGELRQELNLPEVSELDVVRHFTRLSKLNFSDRHRVLPARLVHDEVQPQAERGRRPRCPASAASTPTSRTSTVQGALRVLYELQELLWPRSPACTRSRLQPAAGAQGELTGVLLVAGLLPQHAGTSADARCSIPDSAHGTNPATAHAGRLQRRHDQERRASGHVDLDDFKRQARTTDAPCS